MQAAGVDEDAEQEALLGRVQPTANRGAAPPAPRILNPHPLQAKVSAYHPHHYAVPFVLTMQREPLRYCMHSYAPGNFVLY